MTLQDAARAMECSAARISLIENGKQSTRPKDIREMASVYGLTDRQAINALEDLSNRANELGWWVAYERVLPANLSTYVDLETDACELLDYSAATLMGLLQTRDYARVVNRASLLDASDRDVERLVDFRMARQARLTDDVPLNALFLLDDPALKRPVGGRDVMRAQLQHLLNLADLPKVSIRAMSLTVGVHAALDGAFTVLRFPDPSLDKDVVYLEGHAGIIYLEKPEHVREMVARHDRLRRVSLDEDESKSYIAKILKEM